MKVSVVLTSYNQAKFLRESIDSVLKQTYSDFELIIVDDCSYDESWEIIQSYTDERIVKIRNEKNLRTEGIYNAFVNIATGEYLAVHHSDDVWEPQKLEKQVAFLNSNKNIAAVFTYAKAIDENGDEYTDEKGFYHSIFEQTNRTRYEWLNYFFYSGNCLCHPSILMRRRLFLEDQLFDFGLAQIPDLSRWVRICLKNDIYIIPEKLVRFRVQKNGKNTSGVRPDTMIRSSVELYHMLNLYTEIPTAEEFVKIFPEGKEYAIGETYIPQYAFARLCTRPEMESYTRLFGYELLYSLMNDRKIAKCIEKQYGFTFRDLIQMTGEKDIFHVLKDQALQCANIYFDFGDGFNENCKIETPFYLQEYFLYDWEIVLPEQYKKEKVKRVRFDPVEGILSVCELVQFKINDQLIKMCPYNAAGRMQDAEVFLTTDPVYVSEELNMQIEEICISGKVERLDNEKQKEFGDTQEANKLYLQEEINKRDRWVEQLLGEKEALQEEIEKRDAWLVQVQREKSAELEQLQCQNETLKKDCMNSLEQISKLQTAYKDVLEKLEKIKSHKLYHIFMKE